MPAPSFTDFAAAVQIALRAARADNAALMGDFVYSTAATKDDNPWYRPWAAAAEFLASDATAMVKGEGGFALADRPTAVAALKARQREEDIRAGLITTQTVRRFVGVSS